MIFLGWDNETKLVPASFSCILDFHSKIKLSLQNVTVLNAIITLHHNKLSWLNCFIYIAFAKNRWELKLRKSKSHRKYFAKESGNRGGSTAAATSKMERFVIIVNGCKLHLGCCSSPRSACANDRNAYEIAKEIDVIQTIEWIKSVWKEVAKYTIKNWFANCAVVEQPRSIDDAEDVDEELNNLFEGLSEE